MLNGYDNLTLGLLFLIACLGTAAIFIYSWKRYELAILLILFSSWISWIFYSNVPATAEEQTALGFGTYIRIMLVCLMGACGALQFLKLYKHRQNCLPNYLILFGIFICYAILSVTYSIDRKYTLIRSGEFMFFWGFLLGLHCWIKDRKNLDKVLNIYFAVMTFSIVINAVAAILLPARVWSWEMSGRLQGLTDHPNTFGALCLFAYPIFAWKYMHSRPLIKVGMAILICLTLGMHILSGSRTSLVSAIFGAMIWLFFSYRTISLKHITVGLTFAMALIIGASLLIVLKPKSLHRSDASVATLTGRVEFWKGCIQLIKERPIQGYGYGVAGKIWEDPRFYREGEFLWLGSSKSSLHNGYLSLGIGLGVTGVVMWLWFLVIPIWRTFSLLSNPYKSLILAMIFQGLLLNFFESALSSGSQINASLVFWLFFVIAGRLPDVIQQKSLEQSTAENFSETSFGFNDQTKLRFVCVNHSGSK